MEGVGRMREVEKMSIILSHEVNLWFFITSCGHSFRSV